MINEVMYKNLLLRLTITLSYWCCTAFLSATMAHPTSTPNEDNFNTNNLTCTATVLEIRGVVFEDFNYNGSCDTDENIGVENIAITATDPSGNTFNATTNTSGQYVLSGLTNGLLYRVTFSNLPTWASPTAAGSDNGTTVQFVRAGNCANLGVASPTDYCDTTNPEVATPCFVEGDPTAGGNSGTMDWLVGFNYNNAGEIDDGSYPAPNYKIDGTKIGSTWGVAYQRQSQNLFAAATIKRHSGLGTDGTDAIYKIDLSGASPVVSSFLNLSTYAGVNTGANPRDGTANNTLSANTNSNSRDINAFSDVGKVAFGDLEISEDGETLFVINLHERNLHSIDIGSTPTAPATINTYNIGTAMPTLYPSGCTNASDYRPWALEFYKGLLYIGVVCSAETSQVTSDLHAYVISFDPAQPANGFSAVFDFDLNYSRQVILDYQGNQIAGAWRPWITNWNQVTVVGGDNNAGAPQPIFTDIEFDTDGSMIIGLMDRFGSQSGFFSYGANPADNDLYIGIAGGDILRACKVGSNFVIEGNSGCNYKNGFEYYDEDFFFNSNVFGSALTHNELSFGSLALLPGKGEVAATIYDPFWIQSGGIAYYNNQTANVSHEYELYNFNQTSNSGPFGKANGLGDLEILCAPSPIEIGNYVWNDRDGDGLQGANEAGIDGVTVQLLRNNIVIATTQTANGGQYYFSNQDAADPNLNWVGTGANTALLPNTNYQVRIVDFAQIAALSGFSLTTTDGNANSQDSIDNDASSNNGDAEISFATSDYGRMNHTLDFGFRNCSPTICLPVTSTLKLGAME